MYVKYMTVLSSVCEKLRFLKSSHHNGAYWCRCKEILQFSFLTSFVYTYWNKYYKIVAMEKEQDRMEEEVPDFTDDFVVEETVEGPFRSWW